MKNASRYSQNIEILKRKINESKNKHSNGSEFTECYQLEVKKGEQLRENYFTINVTYITFFLIFFIIIYFNNK